MGKRKVIGLLMVAVLAVILSTEAPGQVVWKEALYLAHDSVTLGWTRGTQNTEPETYEVVAVWEGSSGIRQEYNQGETDALEKVIPRPRTGFFHFKVRAKQVINGQPQVSEWAVSTNPEQARVDGVPMGFRVYFELKGPPGGGII